jgi:hypothetical protein
MSKLIFDIAERNPVKCYRLSGITYVPHSKYSGFAYPGITKQDLPISESILNKLGAIPVEEFLYRTMYKKSK